MRPNRLQIPANWTRRSSHGRWQSYENGRHLVVMTHHGWSLCDSVTKERIADGFPYAKDAIEAAERIKDGPQL